MARQILFYLFPNGKDFQIKEMTDGEALELKKPGEPLPWVDVPRKTRAEAEELRQLYLKDKQDS